MSVLSQLEPRKVFAFFEEISAIPRGSGNMDGISAYCMRFAAERSLRAVCDASKNVIIFKDATAGYESSAPIILQGHLDMVCQKRPDKDIDFEKDGIKILLDGDRIYADGTTLGADNGIAVAMVLAILDSDDIPHPPIEAVFTTDEEVGMLGALELDCSVLSGKRMINLDSEEEDCMTVSCAGGSDLRAELAVLRKSVSGTEIHITLEGLRGGHSGVCIHEGRVNASILAGRFLKTLDSNAEYDIISVNGGDKSNAIPPRCDIRIISEATDECVSASKAILNAVAEEISAREPEFTFDIKVGKTGICDAFTKESKDDLLYALVCTPDGVQDMSMEIPGLVETSLNLGILQTEAEKVRFSYALRSNKKTALRFLEEKTAAFFSKLPASTAVSGQYPPWEFKNGSVMQELYRKAYLASTGSEVRVEAIHAGLECGVFADKIPDFDCIAIGPEAADVHTVSEHLSAASVARIYSVIKEVLANCR